MAAAGVGSHCRMMEIGVRMSLSKTHLSLLLLLLVGLSMTASGESRKEGGFGHGGSPTPQASRTPPASMGQAGGMGAPGSWLMSNTRQGGAPAPARMPQFTLQRGADAQEGMMSAPMPEGAPQNGAVEDQLSFQPLAVSEPENKAAAMAVAEDMAANQAQAQAQALAQAQAPQLQQVQAQAMSHAQTPPVVSQEATVQQAAMSGNGFNHRQPSNGQTGEENGQQSRAFNEIIRRDTDLVHRQRRETAGNTSQDGQRTRRDSKAECDLEHQYWDKEQCRPCLCPPGQQSTAKICGYGVVVGEPGCEPCPNGTYHSGKLDEGIHCHPCKTCDPDANEVAKCNATEDTVCACKAGFGKIETHCVSCRDHPYADGCLPVGTTTNPPEPSPDPAPEPSPKIPEDQSKKQGCSCVLWKAGLIGLACCICCVIISLPVGMCIQQIRQNGEREVDLQLEQRNGHAVDAQETPSDDQDPQHSPTENRVSTANGEADGLLSANINVHVPVQ